MLSSQPLLWSKQMLSSLSLSWKGLNGKSISKLEGANLTAGIVHTFREPWWHDEQTPRVAGVWSCHRQINHCISLAWSHDKRRWLPMTSIIFLWKNENGLHSLRWQNGLDFWWKVHNEPWACYAVRGRSPVYKNENYLFHMNSANHSWSWCDPLLGLKSR